MPNPNRYPGRLIKIGDSDANVVSIIQARLGSLGYALSAAGIFDTAMKQTLALYQSQHADLSGRPLRADGVVGPITWASLFGAESLEADFRTCALAEQALAIAKSQDGIRENPVGSNRGPEVDQYLASTGIAPDHGSAKDRYWCMAFVYWSYELAAQKNGLANPLMRTAGCLAQWDFARANLTTVSRSRAVANPGLIGPGMILILDHGGGEGHTGIIQARLGANLTVVEGNASGDPVSNNGIGVMITRFRSIMDKNVAGFISCC